MEKPEILSISVDGQSDFISQLHAIAESRDEAEKILRHIGKKLLHSTIRPTDRQGDALHLVVDSYWKSYIVTYRIMKKDGAWHAKLTSIA